MTFIFQVGFPGLLILQNTVLASATNGFTIFFGNPADECFGKVRTQLISQNYYPVHWWKLCHGSFDKVAEVDFLVIWT